MGEEYLKPLENVEALKFELDKLKREFEELKAKLEEKKNLVKELRECIAFISPDYVEARSIPQIREKMMRVNEILDLLEE